MADETRRGHWGNWCEFLMSIIGCLVGLGNIWRFPYLCYVNGGGAFLVPFLFFLLICAVPLVFLEMSYSQFASLGPGRVWRLSPLFKGIGYGMITLTGLISIYYNVIISWAIYYFFMSFRSVLPWSTCGNEWNTPACSLRIKGGNSTLGHTDFSHNVNFSRFSSNSTIYLYDIPSNNQSTINQTTNNMTSKTPSEEFWENHVLEITGGVEDLGTIRWQLLLCLFLSWLAVFLCLIKGIKSFGKVAYVTSLLPYVFLLIILIRGATLPGAIIGVKYYLIPRWEKLLSVKVWGDAAVQVFYSIGLAWGGIATLASYNRFSNNCYRDALLLPILDGVTSWFAGFVIFVVLGFMSHQSGLPIDKVVAQGPGIAFMVYPEALAQMPVAPVWSVFFFLMLLMVGLDSQFVHVETIVSAAVDTFPRARRYKTLITAAFCVFFFLLGLPCVLQGGVYVLQIIDWYCASVSVMLLALMEVTVLAYVYGVDRIFCDIELMIGYKPPWIWKALWLFITPGSLLFIWAFSMASHTPVEYGDYSFPGWAVALGWFVGVLSLLPIPICMATQLYQAHGSILQRIKQTATPSAKWGPWEDADRRRYLETLGQEAGRFDGCFGRCRRETLVEELKPMNHT